MSLFDDNYMIALEQDAPEAEEETKKAKKNAADDDEGAAAPEAKEECTKEGEDKGTPETDPEVEGEGNGEGDEEVEKNAAYAVDIDIEADSISEAFGFGRLMDSEVEEAHYAFLEAVAINTAFDQADMACTEAYINASSEYEKQIVTEKFTDSVKKYAAKIKDFLVKIKNLVVRIFNKAINYIKILAGRANAKLSSLRKMGDNQKIKDGTKVKVCQALLGKFKELADKIDGAYKADYDSLIQILNDAKTADAESLKTRIENVKPVEKSEALKVAYDPSTAAEMDLGGKKASDVNNYLNDLKQANISSATSVIKTSRDAMWKAIGEAEKVAKSASDIDTAKMTCITSTMNKLMSIYNRTVNAKVTLLLAWINARAKIVRAAGWKHVNESYTGGETLFDKYFSMI